MKDRIEQELMLRGASDFDTLDGYRSFVAGVVAGHNRRHHDAIEIERGHLKPTPAATPVTWDEASVRVTSSSGFSFRHAFYTVPSRLIGHRLHLRVSTTTGSRLSLPGCLFSPRLAAGPRPRAPRGRRRMSSTIVT